MDALIDERIFLESILSQNLIEKFNDSMISKGYSYEINQDHLDIDKEIDTLFDENTRKIIKELIKSE